MTRTFSLSTKVFAGTDQPLAKVQLPEAVHGDSSGQRMISADKPAGKSEPIIRCIGRHRRKCCRNTWFHFVSRPIVLATDQDMSLPRLFHFLHDHHGWQIFGKRTPLLPEFSQLTIGIANHSRSMVVQIVAREFVLLSNITGFRSQAQDFGNRLRHREQLDFRGSQIPPIDPDVVHHAHERSLPAADSEWLLRQCKRLIQSVKFYVHRNGLTIDVDSNPFCQP